MKYTKELLEPLVKSSFSWASVTRKLHKKANTGTQSHIKKQAILLEIDYSHFTGSAWNRGRTFPSKIPIEDYLSGIRFISSNSLKNKLWKEGLKLKECEECHITKWQGEDCVLELDHINSDHTDNRIENLKILCPNCHALKTRKDRNKK